jgi:hypothetical protein
MTFVTRHQQPIALVATTNHLLESDRDYAGSVEIETNCGDLSVGVRISVASPLRAFGDIYHWYLPLFVSALAPIFAGEIATLSNAEHAPFYCVGLLAGGLLFAAAWVVCTAAETGPAERMAMAAGSSLTLLGVWLFWINRHVHALGPALLFSVVPSGVLFVAQGLFMQRYSASWGRWQVWGWVVGAIAALVTFFLWRAAQ